VIFKTFSNRQEAELFKGLLEANGIESFVVSDDCGAEYPVLGFGLGVHLLLSSKDLRRARRVLTMARTSRKKKGK